MSNRIFDLLSNISESRGVISYLKLIKNVLIAFCNEDTTTRKRIKAATYCTEFCRLWRQDVEKKFGEDSKDYFITQNAYECIEINLMMIISLSIKSKSQFITQQSSQCCENFFRMLRSYTTLESTIVNFSMKNLMTRLERILYTEKIMSIYNENIEFTKMRKRDINKKKVGDIISQDEIIIAIGEGIREASLEACCVGMTEFHEVNKIYVHRSRLGQSDNFIYDFENEEDFLDINVGLDTNNTEKETSKLSDFDFSKKRTGLYFIFFNIYFLSWCLM